MSYSKDGDTGMADASCAPSNDSLHREDRPGPILKPAAEPEAVKSDQKMEDDTLSKPDLDQPRRTTEMAEPHTEVPAGDHDGDDQEDDIKIKYKHRGQFVEALAQLRDSTRTLNAAHERTQAYFDQRDAEAPAMEEKMKKANAFANDFVTRVAEKRKAKEREAEEQRRQAEAEAQRLEEAETERLEEEEAEARRMGKETVMEEEEAPLPNAFEDTAIDALDSPDDAINIFSDKAEQMSIGGKKTPEMLAREKHRLSEDSKFSKNHHDKKHHAEPLEKVAEENQPTHGNAEQEESSNTRRAGSSKMKKSIMSLLGTKLKQMGSKLNLFRGKPAA